MPDDNPIGIYRKIINVDNIMAERENYIIFEGVSSCIELFINGKYVGFSTVSHCTSEFKIALRKGENEIIAKVYKRCVGSYLEDQDFFRHNGIFRDVYILSRQKGLCPPSKNGHRKASKNGMNRSLSRVYERLPHLFHGLLDNEPLPT